jgi:hypothetical protein
MTGSRSAHWPAVTLFALSLMAVAPVAATQECAQVRHLLSQGLPASQIAAEFGVPVSAVRSCLAGPVVTAPAGRPPIGAAGPAPHGAAGPPPHGAAGPAPHGAAGPAPSGAAGAASIGAGTNKGAMNR